ncbi:unnamed protein product [Hymenolepis diminuta]|uniref:PPR_long domain-containing protein n=1 Tax=Hymenolepis diminuta TaxID=6216 RepID=A0A158QE74_HYMDI|nr:unnamed protein product [Hymenolepis diminuta]
MIFLRQIFTAAALIRISRSKLFHFPTNRHCLFDHRGPLKALQCGFSSTLINNERRASLENPGPKNAFDYVYMAERNRFNIRLMNRDQQKMYFNDLWEKITSDRAVRIQTVSRFLNLKSEFGFETSYEGVMADLQELGLKPDAMFFSVFIKNSCEKGDMEKTSHYLKAMHQEGAVPNDYIFSKILHGYVKCGLPDEVAVTQDVMSKLNYWPSMMATEDLLLAYADLGDGNSVTEIIQETLNKSESLVTGPVFSPRFLADLYVRLSLAPQSESNEQAFTKILDLLKRRPPYFDDFRLGNALIRLLQESKFESAFQLLRNTRPQNFSTYFLTKIPEVLADQDPKVLNDFWIASGSINRLPELVRNMTIENTFRTVRANPPLRTELYNSVANIAVLKTVRFKNIESAVELGRILGVHRSHLLYLSVIPRLLTLGLKPEEILAKFEPPLRSSAALGIVLSDLCAFKSFQNPPQSHHSLENASKFIEEYQRQGLLPFNGYLSVNNNLIYLLVRGCNFYVKENGKELNASKVEAWMDSLFSCFLPERHPLLAGALFRFFGRNQQDLPAKSATNQVNSDIDVATKLSLAKAFLEYFDKKKIPVSYLDLVRKSLIYLGLPNESLNRLIPAGNASKRGILVSKIQAGEIDEVIEELRQMQKSISQETSVLGPIHQFTTDILGEAFAISTPVAGAEGKEVISAPQHFTSQQMENLFWALNSVSGIKSPSFSATKIGELYLNARDLEGLVAFMNRMADECPQHLSITLSRWFITKIVELDAAKAIQIMEEVLQKPNVSIPTMALGAYNLELGQAGLAKRDSKAPPYQLGVKLLTSRLEPLNHLRKVRTIHSAIEELCQNNQIFAAYALRDWACQIGLTLLPQTTETLLASNVFMDAVPRIPIDLLAPERMIIRGGISLARLIPRIRGTIFMVNSTETVDEATMLAAANDVTKALVEHPFVVDSSVIAQTMRPSVFKQIQFAFWSAVSQALDSAGSRIAVDENLARIANGLITEGYEAAVLSWISCLLRTDKIAALCCGGLMSNRSSEKFVQLLIQRPELQFAVATSPALTHITPEQRQSVIKNFEAIKRGDLPTLAQALINKEFDQAKIIIDKLGNDAIPVLAGFVNCRFNFIPLVAEALKDKPLDDKIAFINQAFDVAQTYKAPLRLIFGLLEMAGKANMLEKEKTEAACLKDRVSIPNQVFLRAYLKNRTPNRILTTGFATGLDYLQSTFPGPSHASLRESIIQATRLNKNQVLYDTLATIQKSDPSKLQDAAKSVVYSQFLTGGHRNAILLLFSAANHRNDELLEACVKPAMPFLFKALGTAFKGLVDIYRQIDVDPVIYEAIGFHRLRELTLPIGQSRETPKIESLSLKFDRTTTSDISDPVRLAKESVKHLADTLASNKLTAENAKVLVDVVRKLWGPGRIDLLLCHLVEVKASESVDQVIESLTPELRDRRIPFKTLCSLLKLNSSGEVTSNEQFASLIEDLRTFPSQSLTLCMNGPHVSTLFKSWPESCVNEALDVIENTLDRFQPLLRLQLAASLIHRGLSDRASSIIEKDGPLPFNYLAGSLNHPLDKSSYHNSFQYLKATDPEHLAAFVDASLRNAGQSFKNASSEVVIKLLKAAMEESPADLKSYCQSSTLRILSEATKNCEEIQRALFKMSDPKDEQK